MLELTKHFRELLTGIGVVAVSKEDGKRQGFIDENVL